MDVHGGARRAPARLTHADVAAQYNIMHTVVPLGLSHCILLTGQKSQSAGVRVLKTWRGRGITCTIPAHLHSARRRGKLSMISMEETSSPKVRSIIITRPNVCMV